MERAEQIRGNPKYVEAIAKHHEKKSKHHRKLADGMKSSTSLASGSLATVS